MMIDTVIIQINGKNLPVYNQA